MTDYFSLDWNSDSLYFGWNGKYYNLDMLRKKPQNTHEWHIKKYDDHGFGSGSRFEIVQTIQQAP